MEKRVFLAVALSVAVLLGFNALFPPPKPPAPAPVVATSPEQAAAPASPAAAPAGAATPPAPAPVEAAPSLVGETAEREIVVENDAIRVAFSTRGAVVTSWRLKHY